MSHVKVFHCIVDDTALITNISEIESWIIRGALTLIIPLHTIERLHLLKKDSSQIGQNARKAVKFLDDVTSDAKLAAAVVIQEAEERYNSWNEVEEHYVENQAKGDTEVQTKSDVNNSTSNGNLSQGLLTKLTIKEPNSTSPISTPPLSPSSSDPQSSKTSPEVKTATMIANEVSPVPPSLKDLINSIVWFTYEKKVDDETLVFLTNSSDTSYLARDFGVVSKTIHQLRASIGNEEEKPKSPIKQETEPRTLFRYEDNESDEEEVVFKPRGKGAPRAIIPTRNNNSGSVRSKNGHSPATSLSTPIQITPGKPQIPTEEIDPDSFDRGSFARGSIPLASVGNHSQHHFNTTSRGRGNYTTGGQSRGTHRGARGGGNDRGNDRGTARGRGRLFVP